MNDPTKSIHTPELLSATLARHMVAGSLGPAANTLHIVPGRATTATAVICIVGIPWTTDVWLNGRVCRRVTVPTTVGVEIL